MMLIATNIAMENHHFEIGDTSTHSWWISQPAMLVFRSVTTLNQHSRERRLPNLDVGRPAGSDRNDRDRKWVYFTLFLGRKQPTYNCIIGVIESIY